MTPSEPHAEDSPLPTMYPRLEDTNKVIGKDRRALIWIVVAPYILLSAGIAASAVFSAVDVSRITLALSGLSGVGALAGAIVAYYFKAD